MKTLPVMVVMGWLGVSMSLRGAEQVGAPPRTDEGAGQRGQAGPPERPPTFDVSFAGGSFADLRSVLEASSGRRWNLLISPDLKGLPVPSFSLHGVDEDTLFGALSMLRLGDGNVRLQRTGNAWVVQGLPDSRVCTTFYVGHLLSRFKVGDLSTAVRTTWNMGERRGGELKFHEETGLLFILADKGQTSAAATTLEEMGRALDHQNEGATIKALEAKVQALRQSLEERTKACEVLAAKNERAYEELKALQHKVIELESAKRSNF